MQHGNLSFTRTFFALIGFDVAVWAVYLFGVRCEVSHFACRLSAQARGRAGMECLARFAPVESRWNRGQFIFDTVEVRSSSPLVPTIPSNEWLRAVDIRVDKLIAKLSAWIVLREYRLVR